MRRLTACSLVAVCVGASSCLLAQPPFNRWDVIVGVHPHAVVAGDFNGDRAPDVAAITEEGIFVILNRGYTDQPAQPVHTQGVTGPDLVTGFYAPFAAAADFNGDGLDDVVSNGVLLLSRGDGTFRIARRDLAVAVGIGDFNGDGRMDLLRAESDPCCTGKGVRVLLGNGDGTFRLGATITTVDVEQVAVADLNHDRRLDVAVMPHSLSGTMLVFLGQNDGIFGSAIQTQIPFAIEWMYLAADFNGDGIADVTAPDGLAFGKGDGTFQSPVAYPQGQVGTPIAAADFTGDGRVDLVTSDLVGSVFVFPGKGDGTLLPPRAQPVGWGVLPRAAVVDLDYPYSGVPLGYSLDLVTASGSSNSVTFLLNNWRAPDSIDLQRAVSAASGSALVAPGSLATLFGTTPVTSSLSASPPWPTQLGGISLEIEDGGTARLAPLLYVSPSQINFQIPSDFTTDGFRNLAIVDGHGKTSVGGVGVYSVAPGLFLLSHNYGPPAATAIRVLPDGGQVPIPMYTCAPSATGLACDFSPIPLSASGDHPIYLSFFGTGFHGATTSNVTCEINGVQVPVVYAGPQETPGVDQINVRLLAKVLQGFLGETMPVIIRIDGVPANSTLIAVQ
jgi:uncharacterized protein (TIGR03437 family)